MNPHQRKVLDLLAQGKVTVEEASRLLEKLQTVPDKPSQAGLAGGMPGTGERPHSSGHSATPPPEHPRATRGAEPGGSAQSGARTRRFLRLEVRSASGDHVDLRIPLPFLRAGVRLAALLPEQVRCILEGKGVRLDGETAEDPEAFVRQLLEMDLRVSDGSGEEIRCYCE